MKKFLTFALCILVAVSIFAGGEGEKATEGIKGTVEEPYIIMAGTSAPASTDSTSAYFIAHETLNNELMRLSGGTIGFDCVYGGALGSNTQILAQLKAGTLDCMPTGFDLATNLTKSEKFYAVAMPFVFKDDAHMDKFFASDLWAEMVDELKVANGIYISGLYYHQPARSLNTTRPIVHPSDLVGLKIRVPESKVQMEVWKATGANPMQVPASELYTSLDSGIVDGQENDIVSSTGTLKLHEVAPYFTEIDYIKQCMLMYMSEKTWNKMTDEEKGWWNEALATACKKATDAWNAKHDVAVDTIKASGGTIVDFDYAEWQDFFTKIVYEKFDGKYFPSGLYKEIQDMAD